MIAKNEYQRRVSPIVRSGGLSSPIQSPAMNTAITISEAVVNETAMLRRLRYFNDDSDQWSFAHNDTTAPAAESREAKVPNHMNALQVMISLYHYNVFVDLR